MFGKKKCPRCGNKIERKYDYCPYCGERFEKRQGLIDELDERNFSNSLNFGFGNSPFDSIIRKLAKSIEKQFQDIDRSLKEDSKETKRAPLMRGGGISISISSSGDEPVIKVKKFGDENFMPEMMINGAQIQGRPAKQANQIKQIKPLRQIKQKLTKKEAEALTKLPQTEPSTTVRRLTDKLVYEIDLPGVKEKDVIINKMENSIEIKAFTKNRVFFKLIPVDFPILRQKMENGKLVLELKPEV